MRIAYVRGPNLNAWELQNVDGLPHDVVAFASLAGRYEIGDLDVRVRRLPCLRDPIARAPAIVGAAVHRFAGNVDHLFGLERALRGFDVAHVADLSFAYSLQAVRARDAGACGRVIATVWENIAFPPWENRWIAERVRRVAAGVDHCIAISDDARLHLEVNGVPGDRITVLPPGIDLERFRPAEGGREGSRSGGGAARAGGDGAARDARALEVLCVSRLVEEKGVDDLVVAAGLLRRRGVEVRVRLVGGGPLAARLPDIARRMGVGDAVELVGSVPYGDLPAVYRSADVFVLASGPRTTWREQFGFAVVEAMACGLPVVAGHSGSLDEVVGSPESLVVPHEPALLADKLEQHAKDPERRAREGRRNREWAEERYDRRTVAAKLGALYEEVVARPARSSAS